jgi:hypothetical protein
MGTGNVVLAIEVVNKPSMSANTCAAIATFSGLFAAVSPRLVWSTI